jgi:hypothetical protein
MQRAASHLPARLFADSAVPGLLSASAAPTPGVLILHAAGRAWGHALSTYIARTPATSAAGAPARSCRGMGSPPAPPPPHFRSCVHALCLDARHGPVLNFWTTCIYSLDHARPSALFKLYQATPPTSPSVAELPAPADAAAPCAPGRCWRYQHETRPCTKLVGGVLVAGGWERTCPSRHSSLAGPRVAAARHSHPPFSPIPLHSPASACRRVLREGFAPCTRLLAVPV